MWNSPEDLLLEFVRVTWLAVPVLAAAAVHMAVIRADWLPRLRIPMDFGLSIGGRRLFGGNKTWRGAVVMITCSSAIMSLQSWIRLPSLEYFDYGAVSSWLCGAALGAGFILGELPNSFLKRRLGVPPGRTAKGWLYPVCTVLDQVDSIFGCLAALALFWLPTVSMVLAAILFMSLVHILFNLGFVALGLKERAL